MTDKLTKRIPFPKVKEAREALALKAVELLELQVAMIKEAISAGEFEAALKANQWLIEHLPTDDAGRGVVGSSAAEPKELEEGGSRMPQIQIGIALGSTQSQVPALITQGEVIDVKPDTH